MKLTGNVEENMLIHVCVVFFCKIAIYLSHIHASI